MATIVVACGAMLAAEPGGSGWEDVVVHAVADVGDQFDQGNAEVAFRVAVKRHELARHALDADALRRVVQDRRQGRQA